MVVTATSGVQIQDMRHVARAPWPHWTLFSPNTHEFIDPKGDRIIRLVAFERLEPGGEGTVMSASHVPSHPNSYDVLSANLRLPLPDAGGDPIEPIGGAVQMRPECLFWQGPGAMVVEPVTDHIQVNIFLHTDGPSGEPMITRAKLAEMVAKLERDHPGSVRADKGEFVGPDGTVHELLEACWEAWAGRSFRYPNPPRLSVPLVMPVNAFDWRSSRSMPGVRVKPFVSVGADGPAMRLVKLDAGSEFHSAATAGHRMIAVMAGGLRSGGKTLRDLTVLYGPPGEALGTLSAEKPSLIWVVDWEVKQGPLSPRWDD